MSPLRSAASFRTCGLLILPSAIMLYTVFLLTRGVEIRMQQAKSNSNSTIVKMLFNHDKNQLDLQWAKNLTNLKHQKTKFAVSVLTREEDLVTMRWMGDKRVKDTTIFLFSDGNDINSLQKVDRNTYGLTIQSNLTRDAGAWIFVLSEVLLHRLLNVPHKRVTKITMQSWIKSNSTGFHGADIYWEDRPHGWAKLTFFFCRLAPKYDFVWLMEDDVYVPSIEAFVSMLRLSGYRDVVVKQLFSREESAELGHWADADTHFSYPKPWFTSFVCVLGMSSTMLGKIDDYVLEFQKMGFVEYFYVSIATHNNLTILNPSTLSSIETIHEWKCDDVNDLNMNWFHPIKDQNSFRSGCGFSSQNRSRTRLV